MPIRARGCMTVYAGLWGAGTPHSRGAKEKGTFSILFGTAFAK